MHYHLHCNAIAGYEAIHLAYQISCVWFAGIKVWGKTVLADFIMAYNVAVLERLVFSASLISHFISGGDCKFIVLQLLNEMLLAVPA